MPLRLKLFEKRRQEFGRHLIRSLDVLTYCHLLFIYFMDISLLRLLLRSIIQLNYLTPKPFPMPRTTKSSVIRAIILLSNTYCLLVHIFASLPVSREANAGYLHGGLTIQFIGQKAPTSRIPMIFDDLIVIVLQLSILVISIQEDAATASTSPASQNPAAVAMPTTFSAAAAMAARTAARASLAQQQRRQQPPNALGPSTSPPPLTPSTPPPPAASDTRQTVEDEERGQRASVLDSDELSILQEPDEQDGFTGEVVAVELRLPDVVGRFRNGEAESSTANGSGSSSSSSGRSRSGSSRWRLGASIPV
ncbi:uncharacterized protein V2V93DRAFT_373536 [Kockiozyma suomiensis]|uniref:uncharacterized protein n=1 Tax=Kockiozyma suomiensis TaxID=1337062 RepID=UPI003343F596